MRKSKLTPEASLSLYLLSKDKSFLDKINFDDFDWLRFLKLSSFNRILHFVIQELKKEEDLFQIPEKVKREISKIELMADHYLNKYRDTLAIIKDVFEKHADFDYLIVKTWKFIRFATMDTDMFVDAKNIEKTKELFRKYCDADVAPFLPKNQTDIRIKNLLTIDLHEDFFWFRQEYFDNDLIWENVQKKELEGIVCPLPSSTIEMLLTIAHIIYERLHLTLLEYWYIKEQTSEVDWDFIFQQAQKYKWDKNLDYFCSMVNELDKTFFPYETRNVIPVNKKCKIRLPRVIETPYLFPLKDTLSIFLRNLVIRRKIKPYDVAYHIFANLRCNATKQDKYPMFYHWYKFPKSL